jgi:hypothetical protein
MKNNDYDFENVCVVFKEISHGAQKGKIDSTSTCSNSLEYFLEQLSGINGEDFGDRKVEEDVEVAGGL